MHIHDSLIQRSLDIEVHAEVFGAVSILLGRRRNDPVPCPPTPARLSVRFYVFGVAEEFDAAPIAPDLVGGAVEVGGFGVGGEDFGVEEGEDSAL
jgi:hypothetical protein